MDGITSLTDGLAAKKMNFQFFQSISTGIIDDRIDLNYLILGGMDGDDSLNHTRDQQHQ